MKKELNDIELEEVVGGTVTVSAPMNLVAFKSLKEIYTIKGDVKEMRNTLLDLYDANEGMGDQEFDELVKNEFLANGWI